MKLIIHMMSVIALIIVSACDNGTRSEYVLDYLATSSLIAKHPSCVVLTMTSRPTDNSFIVQAPNDQFFGNTPKGPSLRELGVNSAFKQLDKQSLDHAKSYLSKNAGVDFDWPNARLFYFVPKDSRAACYIAKSSNLFVLILVEFQ